MSGERRVGRSRLRSDLPARSPASEDFADRVYDVIRAIPAGRVLSYGSVAFHLGYPRHARLVGLALRRLPPYLAWKPAESAAPGGRPSSAVGPYAGAGGPVPWHRVVNARGLLSPRADGRVDDRQIALLRAEGVDVDDGGRLVGGIAAYGWDVDEATAVCVGV